MTFRFPSFISSPLSRKSEREVSEPAKPAAAQTAQALPASAPPPAAPADDGGERRIHQRFVAHLKGEPCFWALIEGDRLALNDLSLKGFSLPASPALAQNTQFAFTLQREGVPDAIRGRAEVTGVFGKNPTAGCRITQFDSDGEERLHEWLVTHVIRSATVRITEKDAADIVAGRSLV